MTLMNQPGPAGNLEGVGRSDDLFKALAEQAALNGWDCQVSKDRSCTVGKAPEMLPDGSQKVHAHLVFHPRDRVMILPRPGESAERKSLTKNFSKSASLGQWTLTVNDFIWPGARSGEELANFWAELFRQVVCLEDEKDEELKAVFSRLLSTIRAAQQFKRGRFSSKTTKRNIHGRFRTRLTLLAWELRRVPTKNELGRAFFEKGPKDKSYSKDLARQVTELCEANGFSWLPIKSIGRPKKVG